MPPHAAVDAHAGMRRAAGASERRLEASHGEIMPRRWAVVIPMAFLLLISAAGKPKRQLRGKGQRLRIPGIFFKEGACSCGLG
jgi:hypothetical protein